LLLLPVVVVVLTNPLWGILNNNSFNGECRLPYYSAALSSSATSPRRR
jgi:hypothetical protein